MNETDFSASLITFSNCLIKKGKVELFLVFIVLGVRGSLTLLATSAFENIKCRRSPNTTPHTDGSKNPQRQIVSDSRNQGRRSSIV